MGSIDDLQLQFYIACGVALGCILLLFILIIVLYTKINRAINDSSNQLQNQHGIMTDFCYSNPIIMPGEELSRRGFSMYRGSNPLTIPTAPAKNNNDFGIYGESRSNF